MANAPQHTSQSVPPTPASQMSPPMDHDDADADAPSDATRPPLPTSASEPPGLQDFAQKHRRTPSALGEVKETLDARVEYTSDEEDGRTYHKVNQYTIVEEIGRGSYGLVHLANDQFGNEYAVKEFSKSRLRKRVQSQNLRKGPQGRAKRPPRRVKNDGAPLTPQTGGEHPGEENDALYLIREEVAIMKKARHPNLVGLIEVLDDPEEDSLYMVLEMCKKGVVMKVGLDDHADPYSDDVCRSYFRHLVLAIEYLHSQSIIHRDIKPDNLLVSEDDILKIVDFGVSEMFEKPDGMKIKKSAGSPAFLPPELCGKHEGVSGTAADIWSMGICLYCFRYGKIPFNRPGIMEMYEAIKGEAPKIPDDEDAAFSDLITRILDKNPETRIKMPELREHPWITKEGAEPLPPKEENCANTIEPPNELELNRAFTRKVDSLFSVIKAISRFKSLVNGSNDGDEAGEREDDDEKDGDEADKKSEDSFDPAEEKERAKEIESLLEQRRSVLQQKSSGSSSDEVGKGHAQEIGDQEPLHLGIGVGSRDAFDREEATPDEVADSPSAVDFNIYDRAYEDAIRLRLAKNPSERPIMYLTKFVKETDYFKKLENMVDGTLFSTSAIREHMHDAKEQLSEQFSSPPNHTLANLVSRIGLSDPAKDAKPAEIDSKVLKSSILAADTGGDSRNKASSLIERMKVSGMMSGNAKSGDRDGSASGEKQDAGAKTPSLDVRTPGAQS